ncbi:MAG: TraB/GumN family protein [Paraclostridium sp.]|uniref:TraB/GumN family protein n=1 Tax=Paraclostridium sp. TaxID=2023273 RepID=UPI003F2A47CC
MNLKKLKFIIIPVIFIVILFVAISPSIHKKQEGYYWQAKKNNTTIYLIGTLHVYNTDTNFLNNNLKFVFDNTDALALEINLFSDEKLINTFNKLDEELTYLNKGELKDSLNEKEKIKLDSILAELDLKYQDVKNLTPYGFKNLVDTTLAYQSGFSNIGLDSKLASMYMKAKRNIVSLETPQTQLDLLKCTDKDLKNLINNFDDEGNTTNANEVIKNFDEGNTDSLENEAKRLYEKDINAYNSLLKNRNIQMTNKILKLANSNKRYAIAVGAMHFAGKDGIIKQLENNGYTVTKLKK